MNSASVIGIDDYGVFLPAQLSAEQWQKVLTGMRGRGHKISSVDETMSRLTKIAGEKRYVSAAFKDWISALISALDLIPERPAPAIPLQRVQDALEAALTEWGITDDPNKGGFILASGRLLDMSTGMSYRTMDHLELNTFLGLSDLRSLDTWEDAGLIRWNHAGRGLSMKTKPSPAQLKTIEKLETHRPHLPFHMDVYEYRFGSMGPMYPPGVRGAKLVSDILSFYDVGYATPVTPLMEAHYASMGLAT